MGPSDDVRDPHEAALHLWQVLARAHAAVARHVEASLSCNDLTPGEFGVLEALLPSGRLLLGELQRKTLVSSGGVTFLVDRLERRGLVARERCQEDRRAIYAVLTPIGEAMIQSVHPTHSEAIGHALSGLSGFETAQVTQLLGALAVQASALPPTAVERPAPRRVATVGAGG